jgi:hypothetical protein
MPYDLSNFYSGVEAPRLLLSATELELKKRFAREERREVSRLPSVALDAPASDRIDQLVLPDDMRARMPLTKDKYLVKENPHLVAWEREVRKFLVKLSPEHGHRVAAVMIYEWATGLRVKDLQESKEKIPAGRQSWRSDLRKINQILRWYFGQAYMTYICGRKVPLTYRVRQGYYIRHHRPMTLTLWAEYNERALYP